MSRSALPGRNRVVAYLGLGGNLGDPRAAMARALRTLQADPNCAVRSVSPLYRTPPWGKLDQPDFLNAVAVVETSLSPRDLLDLCLSAERSLKRVRAERWGPRTIDIDVLLYGDATIDEDGLTIPHPRMLDRAFVMAPLADVAPELVLEGISAGSRRDGMDLAGLDVLAGGDWWNAEAAGR